MSDLADHTDDADLEPVEEFAERARAFVHANFRLLEPEEAIGVLRHIRTDEEELADVARERAMQRMLFDAGFAGICFPKAYGGQGLTPAHQQALNEAFAGREYPMRIQAPTMSPCAAVLLDFGTEAQKLEHIPAILRGDELWMQFLSEPSGGSDVAGALTSAVRDGDEWILNGSKVWTTGAWWSDWALCLARTNWDVPKHRGLSVFIFPIHQDGIDVYRIELLNGSKEFCQEYLNDLRVPDHHRVGEVDQGWTVGTRWMFHERMLTNSPLVTNPPGSRHGGASATPRVRSIAATAGRLEEPAAKELIGESRSLDLVGTELRKRIGDGIVSQTMSDQASAIGRLWGGLTQVRNNTIAFELAGSSGAAWTDDDGPLAETGNDFLLRQVSCIGGGTTEMARNVVAERVLGMPREVTHDKDLPFREVPKSRSGSGQS